LVRTQRQEMVRNLRRAPVEVLRTQHPFVFGVRRRCRSLTRVCNRDALPLVIAPEVSTREGRFLQVRPAPVRLARYATAERARESRNTCAPPRVCCMHLARYSPSGEDRTGRQLPSRFWPNAVRVA